jgi:hypothetical protein
VKKYITDKEPQQGAEMSFNRRDSYVYKVFEGIWKKAVITYKMVISRRD